MRTLALALLSLSLAAGGPPTPVVLELFTSEGCSSCPPADELLLQLEKEPGVIALGFHVDYWDSLGWKDPFSSHAFTERQSAYARAFRQSSVYTPELVVDGRVGFVGNSEPEAAKALAEARSRPKVQLKTEDRGGSLQVHLDPPPGRRLELWLALTESGLQSSVLRGENRGRQLRHAAVVHQLMRVGIVDGKEASGPIVIDVAPLWRSRHWRGVLLLQDPAGREILGAGAIVF